MTTEGLIQPKYLAMEPISGAAEPQAQPQQITTETHEGDSIRVRPGAKMEEIEEAYINLVLQQTNNNKTKAADILGISVRTLHNRLGQLTNRNVKSASM
jgi:DNA-binding NtrC family response regulator